jgi:hypothetical protein
MALSAILERSHTIAKPGFSRLMVPRAALCIHLCIGQVYAFSVFNLPMTKHNRDRRLMSSLARSFASVLGILELAQRANGQMRPKRGWDATAKFVQRRLYR